MAKVKVDQKMRIRIPNEVSRRLKLKRKEVLDITVGEDNTVRIGRPSKSASKESLVLKNMLGKPMRSKIRVTTELLNKWKDEMWMP